MRGGEDARAELLLVLLLLALRAVALLFRSDLFTDSTVAMRSAAFPTAPKMPPSSLTDSRVLKWIAWVAAAVPSSRIRQSKPLSLASRMVVETQTSVVTPQMTKCLMPLLRRMRSKSVWAKAPLPGLSMMGSPSIG